MSIYYEDEYENNRCDCGSLFDADGWCPYCDFAPGQYSDEDWGEYRFTSWLLNSDSGEQEDIAPLYVCPGCGGVEDGCACGQHEYWDWFDTMDLEDGE